jgi:HPt (histidine-containing phosphotransfer) domain-containing protein
MKTNWDTAFIDPNNLIGIAEGNKDRTLKYLLQFQELIPSRINKLKDSLENKDRKMTRQILHQMSPQIQFFGIPDVVQSIKKLELEYETMPFNDLNELVDKIIVKLNLAIKDVQSIMENNF